MGRWGIPSVAMLATAKNRNAVRRVVSHARGLVGLGRIVPMASGDEDMGRGEKDHGPRGRSCTGLCRHIHPGIGASTP